MDRPEKTEAKNGNVPVRDENQTQTEFEEKELKAWSVYAQEGPTVPELVEDFVSSEEYKSRLQAATDAQKVPRMASDAAAEEYIASLYAVLLRRDPTQAEFAHWVNTAAAWTSTTTPASTPCPVSTRRSPNRRDAASSIVACGETVMTSLVMI